ncbi:MAG: hypothetical protein HY026_03570 [Deltaproteobacteria bacterium]|nr:hypothetical protein [Deltaproteobacteria bacterium]
MWKCESCRKKFPEKTIAIEVRFGYMDGKAVKDRDQYMAFNTENSWTPLCDDCAIAYIKGEVG